MTFDLAYQPVVAGKTLYFGSACNDALTALDTETGAEKWRFYADGPIRFAPAVYGGKVYFVSDDGCLYCVNAETGGLAWKYRGAPSDRKVLGNTRLVSPWPARGAPVVADGIVYFGAGIWSFEGIFLYAINAETGAAIWSNDNCDVPFMTQPHRSPAFAGVTPQGYFALSGDKLLVPNGRAPAAGFDRATGALKYFEMEANNRHGGYRVSAMGKCFFNPNAVFDLETGNRLGDMPANVAVTEDTVFAANKKGIRAYDFTQLTIKEQQDSKGRKSRAQEMPLRWQLEADATDLIAAEQRVYACKPNEVFAVDAPKRAGEAKVSWRAPIEGVPRTLLAADGKLFVATEEGRIYCFGKAKGDPVTHDRASSASPAADPKWTTAAKEIVEATGVREGYGLVFDMHSAGFLIELARQTDLRLVAVESRPENVAAIRQGLAEAPGLAGRISVLGGTAVSLDGPPYFASLIVCGPDAAPRDAASVQALFPMLRPYGGVACFPLHPNERTAFEEAVEAAGLSSHEVARAGELTLLKRVGSLPGAADWTHQYGDVANTVVSRDDLVRPPLGMLWFGGSSNVDILPRHGHGPSEQVVDGRLFIEGPDVLRALDVYTGRVLWEKPLAGLGAPYDNTGHQPGADARGGNYVSVHDGIYVVYGAQCLRLAPDTGEMLNTFSLPVPEGASETPAWGYIGIWEDLLIAGSGPVVLDEEIHGDTWNAIASKRVVVLDRHTGVARWTREANAAFRHNAIAVGGGRVFCIDHVTDMFLEHMKRRGIEVKADGQLFALDAQTGEKAWSTGENVFGTWLGYSEEHDILLQAGRPSRDTLEDEPGNRMIAYRGADGGVLWDKKVEYEGPCMLWGDAIIAQEQFFRLTSGEPLPHANPLTGVDMPWRWSRNHGCNSAIASRHMVLFRSAAAGYFDLANDGGTGNWGGFRSGCTSNLIAANGVLNAPDYTRTCTCSYQNQTSLALVHAPSVEMWTFNDFQVGDDRVRRVGINLGAPGDRRENGTLWLEYPVVGGPSPDLAIEAAPATIEWFRKHSSRMRGEGLNWVAASGGKGISSVRVTLCKKPVDEAGYTVRLHFAEPEEIAPGARVFDVALQGTTALNGFDVVREAGEPLRAIVKEFKGIVVRDVLTVSFIPRDGGQSRPAVLCGMEIVQE